jgi:FHS family glucose/mannose:H+ symporter-like MFS transporter
LENIIALSFCIYVGFEVGYGGWISTYGTFSGIATQEEAAYCSSIFWGCISIGRILAVPFSVRYPTNLQLSTLIISCIASMALSIFLIWYGTPRTVIFICSGIYGFAMSAIYPLLMSMPGFLKCKMSAKNTSKFVVSGALGESLIPLLIGYGINWIGPNTLYWSSFLYSCVIYVLYKKMMNFQQNLDPQLGIPLVEKKYSALSDI